jgi:hypothetical protein
MAGYAVSALMSSTRNAACAHLSAIPLVLDSALGLGTTGDRDGLCRRPFARVEDARERAFVRVEDARERAFSALKTRVNALLPPPDRARSAPT